MRLNSVEGNSQRLDGGAMFGNVPKVMWSKWVDVDENNQVFLKCRCLLVRVDDRVILLETGIGAFFSPKLKERYGVIENNHVLLENLESLGVSPDDVTDIILSHLHFDHVGGALESYHKDHQPKLAFRNARFYVGREALERAKRPHYRDKASFIPEIPDLLEKSKGLILIDSSNCSDLPEAFSFSFHNGHTPGLMLTEIKGHSSSICFVSDLIPGTPWVHVPVTMGYDRFPEQLIDEKRSYLKKVAECKKMLFFTHDPKYSIAGVEESSNSRFSVVNPLDELSIANF